MSTLLPKIEALGTTWWIEIFDESATENTDETFGLVRVFLTEFEAKYSRFKAESTISKLNQNRKLDDPDQTTIDILNLGQQLYEDTSGVFNFLIGKHLVARGYDGDYSFLPKTEPNDFPNPLTDLIVTEYIITLKKGLIDLGGYGKGYLIDRLADYLSKQGFAHFLINGGGDMYASSDNGKPINIYLEHPAMPGTYIAETSLLNQGFAASSTHKRRWKVSGQEYSHIVNTKQTQTIDSDTIGIYTKAPTAVFADAWATTLLISEPGDHTQAISNSNISFACFNTLDNTLTKSTHF